MRVSIAVIATFTLVTSLAGVSSGQGSTVGTIARARDSVVIVSTHLSPQHDAIGAGVVVASSPHTIRVLTARHVTQGGDGDVTVWIDGIGYGGTVVRTFAHRDLAIVDTLVPEGVRGRVAVALLATHAETDDPIVVWGENDAGPRMANASIVSTRYAALDDAQAPPMLAIACEQCRHGDSGGGIFSPAGRLIGILVARYVTPDRHVVAIVGEIVEPSLFADGTDGVHATATDSASTVRSQNDPKLSPG